MNTTLEWLDRQLTPLRPLTPQSLRLTLVWQGVSSGVVTFPLGEACPQVGEVIRIRRPDGEVLLFRVVQAEADTERGQETLFIQHCLMDLGDETVLLPEEIGAKSAGEWLTTLLGQSRRWTLSGCETEALVAPSGGEETLLEVLLHLQAQLTDCRFVYDQSATPWSLRVEKLPEQAECHLCQGRSVLWSQVSSDRTGLCTCLTPVGEEGLDIASVNGGETTLRQNVDRWGLVSRRVFFPGIREATTLLMLGKAWLHAHAAPTYHATLLAQDIHPQTGEAADALQVGRMCRLQAGEQTILLPITRIVWEDLVSREALVTVTLADPAPSLTQISRSALTLAREAAQTGRGNRDKLTGLNSVVTAQEERLGLMETGLRQSEEAITLWAKRVTAQGEQLQSAQTQLTLTADTIAAHADKLTLQDGQLQQLSSSITQTAEQIESCVTDGEFASYITQTADKIRLKANQAEVDALVTRMNGLGITEAGLLVSKLLQVTGTLNVVGSGVVTSGLSVGGSLKVGGKRLQLSTITIDGVDKNVVTWS